VAVVACLLLLLISLVIIYYRWLVLFDEIEFYSKRIDSGRGRGVKSEEKDFKRKLMSCLELS
jgi:hypothetical protein